MNWFSVLARLSVALLLTYCLRWLSLRRRMPPGPLGLPFIGNRHQLPAVKPWRQFSSWNAQYGPVVSIYLGSTPVIVLGTARAAWDLLEKRSDIYSSRPRFIVAGEIFSDNKRGLMLPTGDHWRKWRKILHLGLHARKADTYKEIQSMESKMSVIQILRDPKNYEAHLQRYAGSVVTSVTYGRRITSMSDWVVKENMEAMDYLTSVNIPGKYLVESWPWLLRLPRSFQWFRREPEERRQRDIRFLTHLFNGVKEKMDEGEVANCITAQTIRNKESVGMTDIEAAYAVSSPFGAGIETTSGSLSTFVLAMLHFPEVLKTAQAEIDARIGRERLPEFTDKDDLPYVSALVNETLRWHPIAVLGGTPHAVTADDVYEGWFIPKGSTVFANLYGIMQDPEMFPEPQVFRPERFLETQDPRMKTFDLPFGFGRRQCPGLHLARNSLFINIARMVWAFNIKPVKDANGKEILPDPENYTNGFNSRPVSFQCDISPRDEKAVECIEREWNECKL